MCRGANLTRLRYQPVVALRIQPCLQRDCRPADGLDRWLEVASQVEEFVGFAVGRSIWEQVMVGFELSVTMTGGRGVRRDRVPGGWRVLQQRFPEVVPGAPGIGLAGTAQECRSPPQPG